MAKTQTTSIEKVEDSALALPDNFNITPKWEVPLSKTVTAFIYDVLAWPDYQHLDAVERNKVKRDQPAYRVIIRNKAGGIPQMKPQQGYGHRHSDDDTYRDPLDVMLHLRAWAYVLAKKKKTTVEESDSED